MKRALTDFLSDLFENGEVKLAGAIHVFTDADLQQAGKLLQHRFQEGTLEMPPSHPAFVPDAALWSAQYLYRTIQFALLRDLGPEVIEKELTPYPNKLTPGAICSADLCLRHLPAVFNLAKGLSPGDILVEKLKQTALEWPFSSMGIPLEKSPDIQMILAIPSLRTVYIDRIIAEKDFSRIQDERVVDLIWSALGNYAHTLWPEFEKRTDVKIE